MQLNFFLEWRDSFLQVLQQPECAEPLKQAALSGQLKAWTGNLTSAVVNSCIALDWPAAGKGHVLSRLPQIGQEYLGIDVMAFPKDSTLAWPFPVAAFELENDPHDERVAYSFWKVLCLRVRLRVVFAYRPDWERSRQLVNSIGEAIIRGMSPEQRTTLDGQTVLAVGNRGEGETFPWGYFKFWMLDPNLGRFEKV